MKKSLAILLSALLVASPVFAAKKAKLAPQKTHPQYQHQKAPKKAVPARDTSPMPKAPAPKQSNQDTQKGIARISPKRKAQFICAFCICRPMYTLGSYRGEIEVFDVIQVQFLLVFEPKRFSFEGFVTRGLLRSYCQVEAYRPDLTAQSNDQ